MHTPVLLNDVIDALKIEKGKKYIDATAGELGHLNKIAELGGKVLGIDYDKEQIRNSESGIKNYGERVKVVWGNFADIEKVAQENGFSPADGILFDLGVSYEQISRGGKGLSYKMEDEILDMRIGPNAVMSARELLNTLGDKELYQMLARYSEEPRSEELAKHIVNKRKRREIATVKDLTDVIDYVVGRQEKAVYARVFQALRIAVNREFENLEKGLEGAFRTVRSEGVIVVITFHSLEDRLVKRFIKNHLEDIKESKKIIGKGRSGFERSAIARVITKN